jgi:ribosomal protein S18 acetylase RimI-like enzyme
VPPTAPGGPEGITLSPVVAVADVRDLAEVTGAAYAEYGLPRAEMVIRFAHPERWLRPYLVAVLARDATTGDALGSGLLVLSHGIGGLYLIATVPEARRRGIGAAVTRALSDHAFAAGARFVTLQASGMGEAIYRRLGFETTTLYRSLLAPA